MAERAAGSGSPFAPYIASLPAEGGDSAVMWAPEDLQALQGTRTEVRGPPPAELFAREVAPIMAARPDLWPPEECGLQQFVAAVDWVQSRAFQPGTAESGTGAGGQAEESNGTAASGAAQASLGGGKGRRGIFQQWRASCMLGHCLHCSPPPAHELCAGG